MVPAGLLDLALKIEGPYKWYIIGGVIIILTALLTRFIFKTLKWFFIIAAIGIIVITVLNYLADRGIIDRGVSLPFEQMSDLPSPSP
jgi:putative flippase GtrA